MINLGKYFKQDIVVNGQTLKPVIVITEPSDNSILFTLTSDKDEILNNNIQSAPMNKYMYMK